jgi:ATP-binding cassette subfamily F protein 3
LENLIQLQKGSKGFGSKTLFDAASFAVNEHEHVGVIGPNGAGKTTLFKILTEEESLDSGTLVRSRRLRLGYLSQHDQWTAGETVESFVERGATMPIWEMKALGAGLGLSETHYASAVDSLSGGYRMRAKLLRLIGSQPNLMLLDEPTNYLDLETLLVLEKFLQGFDGAFLLISHDREFLRRTTDHTLEVEAGDVVKYNGNIDDYFEQKEMLRSQLEARAQSLEEKRKEILDFVARFGEGDEGEPGAVATEGARPHGDDRSEVRAGDRANPHSRACADREDGSANEGRRPRLRREEDSFERRASALGRRPPRGRRSERRG